MSISSYWPVDVSMKDVFCMKKPTAGSVILLEPIDEPFSSLTVPDRAVPTYAESSSVKTILYFHGILPPSTKDGVIRMMPVPFIQLEFS